MRLIVTDRIAWSLSVAAMSPAETAESIEMPFGLWARMGPSNHVIEGIQIPPTGGGNFEGKGRPIVKYRDALYSELRKNGCTDRDAFWGLDSGHVG